MENPFKHPPKKKLTKDEAREAARQPRLFEDFQVMQHHPDRYGQIPTTYNAEPSRDKQREFLDLNQPLKHGGELKAIIHTSDAMYYLKRAPNGTGVMHRLNFATRTIETRSLDPNSGELQPIPMEHGHWHAWGDRTESQHTTVQRIEVEGPTESAASIDPTLHQSGYPSSFDTIDATVARFERANGINTARVARIAGSVALKPAFPNYSQTTYGRAMDPAQIDFMTTPGNTPVPHSPAIDNR